MTDPAWHIASDGTKERCLRFWPCPTCDGGIEERRCRICELIDPASPSYSPGMRRMYHPEEFPDQPAPVRNGRLTSGHYVNGHVAPMPTARTGRRHWPLAGDLMAAATKRIGADRLTRWLHERIGVNCRCQDRQRRLNEADRRLRKWLGM